MYQTTSSRAIYAIATYSKLDEIPGVARVRTVVGGPRLYMMEPSGTRQNLPEHSGTCWPEHGGTRWNMVGYLENGWSDFGSDCIRPPIFRCDIQLLFSEVFTETHPRPCRGPPGPTFARHRRTRGRDPDRNTPREKLHMWVEFQPRGWSGSAVMGSQTNRQTNRHCRLFIRLPLTNAFMTLYFSNPCMIAVI
jgi:hypothetical protein